MALNPKFSPQETDVLERLCRGESYRAVRQKLELTTPQLYKITRGFVSKLGASSTIHAIALVTSLWLIEPNGNTKKIIRNVESLEFPGNYHALLTEVALGRRYKGVGRSVGYHPSSVKRIIAEIRTQVGARTTEQLIASLSWANALPIPTPRTVLTLDAEELKLLESMTFNMSAAKTKAHYKLVDAVKTIQEKRTRLMTKMGASHWFQAVALGIKRGWIAQTPIIARMVRELRTTQLPSKGTALLQAIANGEDCKKAGWSVGYRHDYAYKSVLTNLKDRHAFDVPLITYFAALVWAGHIDVSG